MNSLYTLGVRQTNSLQGDLERLRNGDQSASLLGQISASLAAMARTVDDYDSMAKREIIKAKQEKAQMRVQKFRSDYNELKNQFDTLKNDAAVSKANSSRNELLSTSTNPLSPTGSDPRRRFQPNGPSFIQQEQHSESPFRTPTPQQYPYNSSQVQMRALDEHSFLQDTHSKLDDFLQQGSDALANLVDQRTVLKGTQRRLMDAGNTLGLSREVIGWVERRSTQDMYIFIVGAIFTFVCFYLILKYLG